jgi:hypothetical protein
MLSLKQEINNSVQKYRFNMHCAFMFESFLDKEQKTKIEKLVSYDQGSIYAMNKRIEFYLTDQIYEERSQIN